MSDDDHRIPGQPLAGALASAALCSYLLPGLAGARARRVSDGASVRTAAGVRRAPACIAAALCRWGGIEDRTSSGGGYALTFDDGPHPQGTPAVLEILSQRGVPATFFLVGEQVRRSPSLAREIIDAGHRIGLHCDRHRNLLRLTPWQVRADINRAQQTIEDATGMAIGLYRPPYGVLNGAALCLAHRRRWRTLLWSHWGRDWEAHATPASITTRVTSGVSGGSVLLLHDADDYSAPESWRRTAGALPLVLDRLAELELEPVWL
jgi:peptidoglycan-N-acetylglucosamine deacetylase